MFNKSKSILCINISSKLNCCHRRCYNNNNRQIFAIDQRFLCWRIFYIEVLLTINVSPPPYWSNHHINLPLIKLIMHCLHYTNWDMGKFTEYSEVFYTYPYRTSFICTFFLIPILSLFLALSFVWWVETFNTTLFDYIETLFEPQHSITTTKGIWWLRPLWHAYTYYMIWILLTRDDNISAHTRVRMRASYLAHFHFTL